MLKRILMLVFWGNLSIIQATTFHTLPFNGNNSFAQDEDFPTSTDTIFAYCTWDDQYLYLAYTSGFIGSPNDTVRSTYDIFWYIDTDPHPENPKSGAGHDSAGAYWTQIMEQQPWWFDKQAWELPFNADYFIKSAYSKKDSVYAYSGPWDEASHSWKRYNLDTSAVNLNLDQDYYEVRLPLDSLNNPADIFILGYIVSNEWKSDIYYDPEPKREVGGTLGSWPWSSIEGGDGDHNDKGKFNHWFHFHLQNNIHPDQENDPPVVSDIPNQEISQGESFAIIDLNAYVFDDLTPDTLLQWTVNGADYVTVTIHDSNQASITVNDPQWEGSDTVTFICTDEGGKSDSDQVVFTVHGPSDLTTLPSGQIKHFQLFYNYPNPFNPGTFLRFSLPQKARVTIRVFNAAGQMVFFTQDLMTAGRQKLYLNGSNWPSGVYFYQIHYLNEIKTGKMVLTR